MATLVRLLAVVVLGVVLALPGVGGEGGENGSGTGIWVLPRGTHLAPGTSGPPREIRTVQAGQPCTMQMSFDVGQATAILVESVSGTSSALAVNGSFLTLSASLLQALLDASATATILVADELQFGYVLGLRAHEGKIEVRVY